MKIDKEKFNELKQLDRIEFRQRYRNINEELPSLTLMIWNLVIITFLFGTMGIATNNLAFLNIALVLIKITLIAILLNIGLFFIFSIFKHKTTKELEKEYFSVEVKK